MNVRVSLIFFNSVSFFAVFLLPNLKPSFGFEYSLIPFLFISAALSVSYSRNTTASTIEVAIFLILILSLVPAVILGDITTYAKDLVFLMTFLFGIRYFTFVQQNRIKIHYQLFAIIVINLIIASLQLLGASGILDFFLIRQFGGGTNRSVVSALFGEPSNVAIVCCCLVFIFALSSNLEPLKRNYLALVALCALSFSLFSLPFFILYWLLNKKKLVIALTFLGLLVLFILFAPDTVRVIAVLQEFYYNGYLSLLLDNSISSRFDYIARDLTLSYENFFLPQWLGSYPFLIQSSEFIFSSSFGLFDEKKELSGSLFGHFLVELGFIFLIFVMYIFFKSLKEGGVFVFLAIVLLTIVMFQMISLIFYPVAFTLGYFVGFQKLKLRG